VCACIKQAGDLAVNMAVVDADDGEVNHGRSDDL
jgi:hypothetical protein